MSEQRTQYIAVFLIVFGALCIGAGSHFGWRDLVNFATAFGGGGVGILTGHLATQVTNKDNATLTVSPDPK